MELLGVLLVVAGAALMVYGFARAGGRSPFITCRVCGDPLPDGYTAVESGSYYCRACCRAFNIRPWYWKDVWGDPWATRPGV